MGKAVVNGELREGPWSPFQQPVRLREGAPNRGLGGESRRAHPGVSSEPESLGSGPHERPGMRPEEMLEKFDIWEGDWSDMETYFGGGSLKTGTRGRKKKKMLKEKVKARLKATRRRGKRRHKKTLLRDVLDV